MAQLLVDTLKEEMQARVYRHHMEHVTAGVRVTMGQNEVVLASDQAQRERILFIAAALANGKTYPVNGVRLYRADGTELSAATVAHFRAVVFALESRFCDLVEHYGDLVSQIRAATTVRELSAVDMVDGWPTV